MFYIIYCQYFWQFTYIFLLKYREHYVFGSATLAVSVHKQYSHMFFSGKNNVLQIMFIVFFCILYVQEVVTLQKKYSNIFASEN